MTPTETPTKSLFTNLEPHLFPIFPITAYFKLSVPGISTSNSLKKNKNTINIKRTQYPLMLALCRNNQQGSTLESGIPSNFFLMNIRRNGKILRNDSLMKLKQIW